MFKSATILLFLCIGFGFCESKGQNLIRNSSFENVTLPIDCNGGGFHNYSVNPANHVVDYWYTFNSPDYFNAACNISASVYNVPNSIFGASYAKTGNAFAGIYIYI